MGSKRRTLSSPESSEQQGRRLRSRWLWAVVMLLGVFTSAQAQTKDIITFTGGHTDPNYPGVYFIEAESVLSSGGDERRDFVTLTLNRPQGASATREASITLNNIMHWDEYGTTVTFAPGETTATIELPLDIYDYGEGGVISHPTFFGVLRTNHADAGFEALMILPYSTDTPHIDPCHYTSLSELLSDYPYGYNDIYTFRWGEYVIFKLALQHSVKVTADSRLVLKTRYTDHRGLALDADDYGMSKTREVVLTPINAGLVTDMPMYLYKPKDDEYLYSYNVETETMVADNRISDPDNVRMVDYTVSEIGPFEVADPAEGAITNIFLSRADLGDDFHFYAQGYPKYFQPTFSNVSINKTTFKSGETMVITATMDNWHLVKRARLDDFANSFGVTFDGTTIEPRRFDFDESTGIITCYVTAPAVDSDTTLNVDFGKVAPIGSEFDEGLSQWVDINQVFTGSEGAFTVTVQSETATPVPATSIDFVNMPADGSDIALETDAYGYIWERKFPLAIVSTPATASDAGTVTFSVENVDGTGAYVYVSGNGEATLCTGNYAGTIIVKATLPSGVNAQRTYNLTTEPTRVIHTANTYLAGTTLPEFQFEVNGYDQLRRSWDWTAVDDDVTVNYTHANGSKWTEHYQFSKLTSRIKTDANYWTYGEWGGMSKIFNLPFVFTPDHPDATVEQIGQTIVRAEVLLNMQNKSGNRIKVVSTASLEPQLKALSFKGYSRRNEHYHFLSDPTLSSEVMFLTTEGFSVGYEIPELGLREIYDSQSGDPVPAWLQLQSDQDNLYTTATITIHPDLDRTQSYELSLYTLAQRTCIPDEVMERDLTCNVSYSPILPEGNMVYRVNGQNVTGDLTFDNGAEVEAVINKLKTDGFISYNDDVNYPLISKVFEKMQAYYTVYDNVFEGADITLTRQGDNDTIQTLTHFKGCFTFAPPADGRTYIIDVFYPAFNKHYKSTFTSHQLTGVHSASLKMYGDYYNYVFTYTNNGIKYDIPFTKVLNGYIYAEDADEFYLTKEGETPKARLDFPEEFHAVIYNNTLELKTDKEVLSLWEAQSGYADRYYWVSLRKNYEDPVSYQQQRTVTLRWEDLIENNTLVTVLASNGRTIYDATLNYACVDKNMSNPTVMGTATYNAELGGYLIETDPEQYVELIEVVLPGHSHPELIKMNLWSYNYTYPWNRGKQRSFTLVTRDRFDDEVSSAALETLELTGGYSRYSGFITAKIQSKNMLAGGELKFSETADYPTVRKYVRDERFGESMGSFPFKYARVTMNIHSDNMANIDDVRLRLKWFDEYNRSYTEFISPDKKYSHFISKDVLTSFTSNHWLLDFDIVEKAPLGNTCYVRLMQNESEEWQGAYLARIRNNSLDILKLTEENQFNQGVEGADLTQVDNDIEGQGTEMKDAGRLCNKFSYSTPPTLPFTMKIDRDGDVFIVRGIYEQNLLPTSLMSDYMDAAAYADWFNEQFQECMNSVNGAGRSLAEEKMRDLQKPTSLFMGIRGYISGIGVLNERTGMLEVNFNDGGLVLGTDVHVMGYYSLANLIKFGMAIDVGAYGLMGLRNNNAAQGSARGTKIDLITEARFYLNIGAWFEAGFDAYVAEAKCGIVGTAGIDLRAGAVMPDYEFEVYSGSRYHFFFDLTAYFKARALFLKYGKEITLLKGSKTFYKPDIPENPYRSDFSGGGPLITLSRQNVTKDYDRLSRKTRRALEGTRLIDNVSGMAQPKYMLGGQSLLFNNLKTPSDYNDDRLQIYDGSKKDLVDTGNEAPMYAFAEDHANNTEVIAFEQLNSQLDADIINATDEENQLKMASEMSEIHVAWRKDGGEWQTQTLGSMNGSACINPVVAVSKEDMFDTHAAVIWQQGKAMFSDEGTRYIEGSLMFSRFDGSNWSDPMEIMRINRRNIPVDYKMSIKNNRGSGDSILVAMTVKQDVNNLTEPTKLVYLTVTPPEGSSWNYQTHTYYTNKDVSALQMARVLDPKSAQTNDGETFRLTDGANLVAYMELTENGRDLRLTAVDMKGTPTGKLNGNVGMVNRMVNDFQLVVDDEARDLSDVALLWSQCDQEATDNGDGTTTIGFKNRIYTSRLCSEDQQIYFSSPIAVATIESTDDPLTLASMDGYLDGLDMKVAYCASNNSDAAAVREVPVAFTNDIEHTATFNPYDVKDNEKVPVTITVENKGYEVIDKIDVTMGGQTTSFDVRILPMGQTQVKVLYPVADDFDGTIDYEVVANFIPANTNALKARGKKVAGRPHRVPQSGTKVNVRQVDMALNLLSMTTDENDNVNIVAEVNNISLLPLANNTVVKVGLYNTPLIDENAIPVTEVTLNRADLYDTTAKQNKNKIVTLTVQKPDNDQTLYLCTVAFDGSEMVKDVRPLNNVVAINLEGKLIVGDVNSDGKVDVSDYIGVANRIMGNTPEGFRVEAADVNGDDVIDVSDYIGVANIIMTGSASRSQQQTRIGKNGNIE